MRSLGFAALLCFSGGVLLAAPLDAILTATPERDGVRGSVEWSADTMTGDLDIFRVRENDPKIAGTAAGDYHGQHIAGIWLPWDRLAVSGSFWRRSFNSSTDTYRYDSAHLAAQYRLVEPLGAIPAIAVRVSGWSNSARSVEDRTPTQVPGAVLNTVQVASPADRSVQLDIVGTWSLPSGTTLNALASTGTTQLSYGALTATTTRNGCNYNLVFTGNDIAGTLAEPCNATGGVIQQFFDSSGTYGIDVASEIAWKSRFWQVGGSAAWKNGPWGFKLGYLYHAVKREAVDDILLARGKPSYTQNHTIMLEADYQWSPAWSVFGRTQVSSNLFFNEIPVTYNSSSSARFGSKYSLFSVGVKYAF